MAEHTYTLDGFKEHAAGVSRHFEQRRRKFLRQFKLRSIVALLLIFTFPFWYPHLTRWDAVHGVFSSLGFVVANVLAALIIIILIVAFALRPIFRYRYDTLSLGSNIPKVSGTALPGVIGAVHQSVLLKSRIFSELLSYFGDFTMHEERKPPLRRFQKAPNLPAFDVYEASDYIRGVMHGVRVDLAETSLFTQHGGESRPVFKGLFILIDIDDTDTVLRGKFSGQTVLMLQSDAPSELLLKKYDGFKRVHLADSNFGQQVTACTTDLAEAERLLSTPFVGGVLKLEEVLRHAKNQERSPDDRFLAALEHIARGTGEMLMVMVLGIIQWFRTGSFRQQSLRHSSPAEAKAPEGAPLFSNGMQCSFFDDKILISLPARHNLFEPDSLFHPPLKDVDIALCYQMMSIISELVKSTVESLPNEPLN